MHYIASFGGVYFTKRNGTGLKWNTTDVPISLASLSFYVFLSLFGMCSQLRINPN